MRGMVHNEYFVTTRSGREIHLVDLEGWTEAPSFNRFQDHMDPGKAMFVTAVFTQECPKSEKEE